MAAADGGSTRRSGLVANGFGLPEALIGLAAGFVLASVADGLFAAGRHGSRPSGYGTDVASLIGLWCGLAAAAVVASIRHQRAERGSGAGDPRTAPRLPALLARDYGVAIRPWPDVPLGVAVGLASQYGLVWLLELPLVPFVPHLFRRLGQPAANLTGDAHGIGLVVLGVLVCFGSPLIEELYFRGLLLRAVAAKVAALGPRLGPAAAALIVGVVFGLVHFEPLQFLALAGFGVVLSALAWRTGRLGAGVVAHVAFNTAAFISVVRGH